MTSDKHLRSLVAAHASGDPIAASLLVDLLMAPLAGALNSTMGYSVSEQDVLAAAAEALVVGFSHPTTLLEANANVGHQLLTYAVRAVRRRPKRRRHYQRQMHTK
jgi:hypothetical protein